MYKERVSSGLGPVIIAILLFICVGVWWIESRFGVTVTGYVLLGLLTAGAIVVGWMLSLASQKITMENMTEFNRADAMIDRYRMQAYRENARGQAAWDKAQAQAMLLSEKRAHQLAEQKYRMLSDNQQTQQREAVDAEWWQAPEFEDE